MERVAAYAGGVPPTSTPPSPTPTPADATLLRRFVGFVVDWTLSALVTFLVLPFDLAQPGETPPMVLGLPTSSWAVAGVYVVLSTVLVSVTGSSVGHRLMGLQVWQVRRRVFPLQVLLRSVLAALVLPALFTAAAAACTTWRPAPASSGRACRPPRPPPERRGAGSPQRPRIALRSMRAFVGSMPLGTGGLRPPRDFRRLLTTDTSAFVSTGRIRSACRRSS